MDIPVLKENQEKYRDERGKVNMCTSYQRYGEKTVKNVGKNEEKKEEKKEAPDWPSLLAERNRIGDLKKASEDKEYRDKLFQEFGI